MKPIITNALCFAAGAAVCVAIYSGKLGGNASVDDAVRSFIEKNPKVIVDSVQNWQKAQMEEKTAKVKTAAKDYQDELLKAKHDGIAGNPKGNVSVVEFFDYNCPACKMQYQGLNDLLKQDKDIRIVFKEMPIFGPQSDANSRIGVAIASIAPEKYIDFHEKMMQFEGRANEEQALGFAKDVGVDIDALKAEVKKPYVDDKIVENRKLADAMGVQGTPAIVIGEELTPHAMPVEELLKKIAAQRK